MNELTYLPLRDEAGNLTIRGIAWELVERSHWDVFHYLDFCARLRLAVF